MASKTPASESIIGVYRDWPDARPIAEIDNFARLADGRRVLNAE